MVDAVVGGDIPEVSQHHPRRESCRELERAQEDGRHGDQGQEDEEAEPGRRADEGLLVAVMHVMLHLDPPDMVKDIAVEQVLDEGPGAESDQNGQDRGPPSVQVALEGKAYEASGNLRVDVET